MTQKHPPQAAGVAVQLDGISKHFGDVIAVQETSLMIADGEFFSLLGPSGCGKTTTLRMIAGFEQPTAGQIYIKGQPVAGIPSYRRPVNTVFQSYALFPHMTVAQNVAFGLEMKKVPQPEIEDRVQEVLALVQLPGMGTRRPKQLSGGQQQRVALARALINRPQVLLLDEPLGALDLKLRKAMQLELKQIQSEVGITFIYVTHDQEEALTMSDRIAVMSQGEVQQVGQPREIYERPANRFVADFIGETNFVEGELSDLDKPATVEVAGQPVLGLIGQQEVTVGQQVTLAVRPEKLNLYPRTVALDKSCLTGDQFNRCFGDQLSLDAERAHVRDGAWHVLLAGQVSEVIYIGTDTRYRVEVAAGVRLFVRVQNFGTSFDSAFEIGDEVYVHWLPENAQILDH